MNIASISAKAKIGFALLIVLLIAVVVLTLMKPTEQVVVVLESAAAELRLFALAMHIVFLVVILIGIALKRARDFVFAFYIALISLTATIAAVVYRLIPNIILFGLLCLLISMAYLQGKLKWDVTGTSKCTWFFGLAALFFGFWYLHWVYDPIWLNALYYSPLGFVNCPTLLTICGFLILSSRPRSLALESAVAFSNLYFGFYGLLRIGAYVDSVMIFCALFLIVRIGTYLPEAETAGP